MKSWEMVPDVQTATPRVVRVVLWARRQVASMEAGQEDLWQLMATYCPNCRCFLSKGCFF